MRNVPLRLPALGLLVPALALLAHAQGPPVTVTIPVTGLPLSAPAADSFASEPFVVLHQSTVYSFKADGTGYRELQLAVKVQSDAALRQLGVVGVAFASASEHVEFRYVRVRRPDGSVLETNIADAIEEPAPVTREAPFYSDLKQKQLPVKSLHVGDTLEWQVRIVRTAAEAPGQFWGSATFITRAVTLADEYELRVPASITVNVWTNPRDGAAPQSTVEGTERVYRWKHAALKPTVGPAAEAAKKAEETHVLTAEEQIDAEQGKLPSLAWTTFPDWAAVGAWYRRLEATRIVPDDAVKAKVAELTVGKSTDEERAKALYAYVSGQIRYIGVAFGIGRYQPHSAPDVLANQYGDCKDKHTLLAAMLAAAGIPSDAVLIGAGVRFNPAVPSPEAFNHLITRAYIGGTSPEHAVWLDTTAEVAPWRVLYPPIRDESALVIPDSGAAYVAHTPPGLPFTPFATSVVTGTLDKDLNSDSQFVLTYRDDDELGLREALQQVSAAQYPEVVQRMMAALGFGGTTSQASIDHVADSTQPIAISFHYHRDHQPDWGADRITIPFAPISLPSVDDKKPPVSPLQLGVPRTETSTLDLKLPERWSAELPEAVHAHADFANCDVTYRLEAGTLHAERRLAVLKDKVPVADWKPYKTWYDECGAGGVPYVQINRPIGAASGAAVARPTVSNAEAARLIDEANDAMREKHTDKAKELLDKARTLNPEQRNLWGTYGYRAYELGMPTEAVEDYRKELQFHPEQTWVYGPLAEELYRTGHKPEAVAALRSGVAGDPTSVRLNRALVAMIANEGDNAGAMQAGKAALKLVSPDDADRNNLLLAVGTAEVATGDFTDAAELLLPLVKSASTPSDKNNAAYLLAETGLHLDDAEATERSALETLAAETVSWTLDESPAVIKQNSSLLFASWDTLGYILFREGHLPDARNFVEASWRNRQSTEVGLHLGDILLAMNDPAGAMTAYQLAQGTLAGSSTTRGGKTTYTPNPQSRPLATKLEAGIARARSAGAKPHVTDAHAELQAMRVHTLGPAADHSGSVEYRILLSGEKVQIVRPATEVKLTGAETVLRSAAFPGLVPAGSQARVALFGFLNCLSANCEFIAEP
jgi:transglutaminase-like putative cysteine protease/tetratricopeptide (TPR) repeat protein